MEQNSLPKNIRQIGQADKEPRIYIEDYVITFARKMAEKNKSGNSLAVLLGKEPDKGGKEPVFIRGAVEVRQWGETQEMVFDNEIWSNIYEGVKNYFPELEIVGWMCLRSGQEAGFDEKVKFIHETNFAGSGNILFVFDREEKEENFYRFENSHFVKQPGYYIYYEKNEPMQSYMIELFGNKSQEPAGEDKLMEQVRETISNKEGGYHDKKTNNFAYVASTVLAAVILVIGATTLNNYDKMENMQETLNHISENMEDKSENELVVETITGAVGEKSEDEDKKDLNGGKEEQGIEGQDGQEDSKAQNSETEEEQEEEKDESQDKEEDGSEEEGEDSRQDDEEEEENVETMTSDSEKAMSDAGYYIVKKGDTLVTISGAIYGSDEYVDQLQEVNQIENRDMIYEGQKLILP